MGCDEFCGVGAGEVFSMAGMRALVLVERGGCDGSLVIWQFFFRGKKWGGSHSFNIPVETLSGDILSIILVTFEMGKELRIARIDGSLRY